MNLRVLITALGATVGDARIYRLPNSVKGFRVFAFFPGDVADLKFSVSADSQNFQEVKAAVFQWTQTN